MKPLVTAIPTAMLLPCSVLAAPPAGATWDWQLSAPVRPPEGVAVFDTDPDLSDAARITALAADGVYTICYVSVGTLEDYRADRAAFPPEVVGRVYGDWPDERFLDIRRHDILLPLMRARFQRCKDMGFAAVEPDNMDVYDNDSGFDLTRADALAYIRALAGMAHGMGLEIGQKNVPALTGALVAQMDFVLTEDCIADGWCEAVRPYIRAGKPVLLAEYFDTGIDATEACAYATQAGFSMILKDRDLSATRQTCP